MRGVEVTFLDALPAECHVLRDYQRQQIDDVRRAIHAGFRKILVQAPTGAGKTHKIASIALAAHRANLRVLILATRTRLVRQIHERLEQFGVPHGVIAAALRGMTDNFQTVQIASADTLYRRCIVDEHMILPAADIVIFDEAHLAGADSRLKILEQYPNALVFGFTATPARKSGRGLSEVFETLILGPKIPALIEKHMLVPVRIFSVPVVTKEALRELPNDNTGDYQTGELGKLMSSPKITGDVLQNWLRIANGKRTLLFAVNKAHGQSLVDEFLRAGIAAELLTDNDDEETREEVIARLEKGQTTVVVNCFLMAYGVDIPAVECIVLARPTRSVVMFLQSVGRGLRPAPGKESCILIDHGRVVENLGRPTDDFGWTLDDERNINKDAAETQARQNADERPRTCPECSYLWVVSEEGSACPGCGWKPTPIPKRITASDANLVELDAANESAISPANPVVQQFFQEALGDYIRLKPHVWKETPNKARAASWHAVKEKFGLSVDKIPSNFWRVEPITPTPATVGWLKYRRIRFAKSHANTWGRSA